MNNKYIIIGINDITKHYLIFKSSACLNIVIPLALLYCKSDFQKNSKLKINNFIIKWTCFRQSNKIFCILIKKGLEF